MSDYHKAYVDCPYFTGSERLTIHCERGCRIRFLQMSEIYRYLNTYCAGHGNAWKKCTIADTLERFYEEEEAEKRK